MTARVYPPLYAVAAPEVELAREASGPRVTGWWGMAVLILNEAVLFSVLLASYFYLRFNAPLWPPQGIKRPELVIPAILTALLVSSSFVMAWGQSGIKHGNNGRLKLGLAVALLLALAFLSLQGYEYSREEFSPMTNAYGSLFFGITGLHGLHVLVAVLMNIYVQARAYAGHFSSEHYHAVEYATLYWHFVDVVWLFILTSLYLSPYWGS